MFKAQKMGWCCIVDTEDDVALFKVAPVIPSALGFAIIQKREGKKPKFTLFAEFVLRKKGRIRYANGNRYDCRRENLVMEEEWVDFYDQPG